MSVVTCRKEKSSVMTSRTAWQTPPTPGIHVPLSPTLFGSLTFWTGFWAVIQPGPAQLSTLITGQENEKAVTLASLYSLRAKRKPRCFPLAVLMLLPCCVHGMGIRSLFTALVTAFKHTCLKSELSDIEICSTCNPTPGCWVYCSHSWEVPADWIQRWMHTGECSRQMRHRKISLAWQKDHPEEWGVQGWRGHWSYPPFPGAEAPMFNIWEAASAHVRPSCQNPIHRTYQHKKKLNNLQWPFIVSNPSTLNMIT